jgi:thioredoxin 1
MPADTSVTDATFTEKVLLSDKVVIVDFWAQWCGPCRTVSPILEQISSEHPGKIHVVTVNVDDNPLSAMKYQITSIPAIKVFRTGEVVKSLTGARPKAAFRTDLAEFLV